MKYFRLTKKYINLNQYKQLVLSHTELCLEVRTGLNCKGIKERIINKSRKKTKKYEKIKKFSRYVDVSLGPFSKQRQKQQLMKRGSHMMSRKSSFMAGFSTFLIPTLLLMVTITLLSFRLFFSSLLFGLLVWGQSLEGLAPGKVLTMTGLSLRVDCIICQSAFQISNLWSQFFYVEWLPFWAFIIYLHGNWLSRSLVFFFFLPFGVFRYFESLTFQTGTRLYGHNPDGYWLKPYQ